MLAGRRIIALAVFVLLLLGGWSFAHKHGATVTIDYWLGEWVDVPLWLALVASFGLGVVLTGLLSGLEMARMGLVSRRYRSAVRGLEEEVHQLRNLPLAAPEAELAEATGGEEGSSTADAALAAGGEPRP